MSISLSVDNSPTHKIYYACYCRGWNDGKPNHECHECGGKGVVVFIRDTWEVNFSNSNAMLMLRTLGLPNVDYCGYIEPSEIEPLMYKLHEKYRDNIHDHRLIAFHDILAIALVKGRGIGWG